MHYMFAYKVSKGAKIRNRYNQVYQVRIQRGDRGSGPPPPPGKSQVIWVSIGNKQLDPPPGKVGPPPPPWKMLDPLWNLEK